MWFKNNHGRQFRLRVATSDDFAKSQAQTLAELPSNEAEAIRPYVAEAGDVLLIRRGLEGGFDCAVLPPPELHGETLGRWVARNNSDAKLREEWACCMLTVIIDGEL